MKISAVVIGRNDGYGGNLHHRAKHCLNNLIENFDEVIYIDWASPEQSLISEIKPDLERSGKLKVYEVLKHDIRNNNPEYENYIIVECIARNIGIRRSSSDWILSTNIDILLSEIKLKNYRDGAMYTCGRRNVPESFHLQSENSVGLLNNCLTHSNNWPRAQDTVGYEEDGSPIALWDAGDIWSLVLGPGDFQFAHRNVWETIKGFEESLGGRFYADSNVLKKTALAYGYENIQKADEDIFHLDHISHPGEREVSGGNILPMNDQSLAVRNFKESTNSEDWGWRGYELTHFTL